MKLLMNEDGGISIEFLSRLSRIPIVKKKKTILR